jgi:hypothetical protein
MRRPNIAPAAPVARVFLALLGAAGLAGCVPDTAIFHRTVPDLIYSGVTGQDCSMVRLDRGESYCRPLEPPVPPQPYCTRSLGIVDCWAEPERMPNLPPQVAQGPQELTPEQNRVRLARWPAVLQ